MPRLTGWWKSLGAPPLGDRLQRILDSPNYGDGGFRNPGAPRRFGPPSGASMLRRFATGTEQRSPRTPPPVVRLEAADFTTRPAPGLRAIWLGHATVLLAIDGVRLLFDPMWSDRPSPIPYVGPKRFHPMPLGIEELPPLDLVLLSHDHYDHLDTATIERLAAAQPSVRFLAPLGVGAHLERWEVGAERILEVDWGAEVTVSDVTVTTEPAYHFSGRRPADRNQTLWASWAIVGPSHRVYCGGDSGFFPGITGIGKRHGPFDLAIMPIGAYADLWPDIHLTPEEAVEASRLVDARLVLPVHWGTFKLAFHAWDEPAERMIVAAEEAGLPIVIPKVGQIVDVGSPPAMETWWRPTGGNV